ncbi:MAG: U32 family peptidase [Butyrivibrio sp.]|nr:U32 family peptidase [Butyrivibrio sp.]
MSNVELLAPAGKFETMLAAFNAGADAVYLGGSKYGARAYADNFSAAEVVQAIKYAHLHGKKIYMTINTLVKENELDGLYDYIYPFDKAGLDGVIVQDFGVFSYIRENFPSIELHASTQMTLTGANGARFLKKMGATRIVPARELTLEEIKNIKEKEDIEIESFIHGAMCYCYSGACLFSSIVGGRSGNRGRCAQPCRLPYTDGKGQKDIYPLSLRDMCTTYDIPDLIDSGIDSFKIEGRMKSPEYAAGVTAIYRKYIDKYYKDGREGFVIDDEDIKVLKSLYLRSEIGNGYYYKHNGKDMITLNKPGYNGTDEGVIKEINGKYCNGPSKIKISAYAYVHEGEELILTLSTSSCSYTATGNIVSKALKRPTLKEDIEKQIKKLGNTYFEQEDLIVDLYSDEQGVFIPVKELNELRREAVLGLENEIIRANGFRECIEVISENESSDTDSACEQTRASVKTNSAGEQIRKSIKEGHANSGFQKANSVSLDVLISTSSQFEMLEKYIYESEQSSVGRVYVESGLLLSRGLNDKLKALQDKCSIYVALPFITRQEKQFPYMKDIDEILNIYEKGCFEGILVRNVEELSYLSAKKFKGKLITDYGVYNWNSLAIKEFTRAVEDNGLSLSEISLPLELTRFEIKDMVKNSIINSDNLSYQIYGYTPMMITANCLNKTLKSCTMKMGEFCSGNGKMTDRQKHEIPYSFNCRYCMNIIWNTVPVSLHKQLADIFKDGFCGHLRLDFTIEDAQKAFGILKLYDESVLKGYSVGEPVAEYTTGHYKRVTE